MTQLNIKDFRIREGSSVKLSKWPTKQKPLYSSTEEYETSLAKYVEQLSDSQNMLYADNRYSLLLIFQAMDAAGKDSAIKHVLSGINPQGCQVSSFKQPSAEELDHDFLWRTTKQLPQRGCIGVFNRSYYEEVLAVRVHPEFLQAQGLAGMEGKSRKELWKGRYKSIVSHENHLVRNGTKVIKFYLHVSKDEQRERFLARLDDSKKNWKFSAADLKERALWKDYMNAYEECFRGTSTEAAPWYLIPADDKKNAHLIIAQVVLSTMKDFQLTYPPTSADDAKELKRLRAELV